MASTYSPNLRLELIGTGEQQGTWGVTTNTNLGTLIEEAIGGYVAVPVTDGADTVLTANNGAADQSRNMTLNLTGTLTAARNVICPAIEKVYIVKNSTSGGFDVTLKVSGQTGVAIPNGATWVIYVDGTDARQATGSVASGGTGASDAATARTNLGLAIGTNVQAYDADLSAIAAISDSSTGLLQKTAANTWSLTTQAPAFPSGTKLLFQQTAAPTGWTKDTTNNDKALRVVSGAAGTGGTTGFTSVFTSRTPAGSLDTITVTGSIGSTTATGTVGDTTLATAQIPSHTHSTPTSTGTANSSGTTGSVARNTAGTSGSAGGGGSHTHGFTGDAHSHSLSMNGHSHTFTGSAMDFAVAYVDVIIASKD